MLGYRDSGMPESEHNANPDAFMNAPFDEAVEKLVALIREEKPHVIITYPDERKGYNHPDHLMVHDLSLPLLKPQAKPPNIQMQVNPGNL